MTDRINKQMDRVTDLLSTVTQLIECGSLKRHGNKVCGQLVVETIYDDEASMVVIEHGMKGQDFPLHIHSKCIQFLICVKGKFAINVPGDAIMQVITSKKCFTVSESVPHSVHCLEDDSKLIGVVVPAEPAYRRHSCQTNQ